MSTCIAVASVELVMPAFELVIQEFDQWSGSSDEPTFSGTTCGGLSFHDLPEEWAD
jgi:hypothetical protein